jgi:hypothetical protein
MSAPAPAVCQNFPRDEYARGPPYEMCVMATASRCGQAARCRVVLAWHDGLDEHCGVLERRG